MLTRTAPTTIPGTRLAYLVIVAETGNNRDSKGLPIFEPTTGTTYADLHHAYDNGWERVTQANAHTLDGTPAFIYLLRRVDG